MPNRRNINGRNSPIIDNSVQGRGRIDPFVFVLPDKGSRRISKHNAARNGFKLMPELHKGTVKIPSKSETEVRAVPDLINCFIMFITKNINIEILNS